MKRTLCISAVIWAVIAHAASASDTRGVVSVSPSGLLMFGPSLEVEGLVASQTSVIAGVRALQWGLLANVVSEARDHRIESAVMYLAEVRRYFGADAVPGGWYAGPRFEMGQVVTDGAVAYAAFAVADAGYRWLFPRGWCASAGLQAGGAAGWYKGEGLSDPNTQYYPIGQIALSIGHTF